MDRVGIRKANNTTIFPAGTTGGNDLLHAMPLNRTGRITKVLAYNNTGANVTLQFGTLDRTVPVALFVQLLPDLVVLNTWDNEWAEADLPPVEFASDTSLAAAGRTGDIYVLASAAAVLVILEVEEFGA